MGKPKQIMVGAGSTLLTVGLLLTAYVFLGSSTRSMGPKPMGKLQAPNCGFRVKSFCATESAIKQYVSVNDFSDVLESQTPAAAPCSNPSAAQLCKSATGGASPQLFVVKQQGRTNLLTRNQYIAFFMKYTGQHGPLHFVSTTAEGNNILMTFRSAGSTYILTLLFTRQGPSWKIAYLSVSPPPAA